MKYNRRHSTASWGTMAKDWEKGVDYARMIRQRFERAQAAVKAAGLGAALCFNVNNVRYITGTHIGEWVRDKFDRYALCPAEGEPFLWDPAPPAKRISSPWIADRVEAPISNMQGAVPPKVGAADRFRQSDQEEHGPLRDPGKPLGIDLLELPMLRALEAEGIEVVDGQQAMLDAREVKTADEIEL